LNHSKRNQFNSTGLKELGNAGVQPNRASQVQ
jgi:hypothetical protein